MQILPNPGFGVGVGSGGVEVGVGPGVDVASSGPPRPSTICCPSKIVSLVRLFNALISSTESPLMTEMLSRVSLAFTTHTIRPSGPGVGV